MKIYFVRHGETNANAKQLHQDHTEELSKKGLQQARLVAERFSSIPVDIILSSPYKRAQQTALEIEKKVGKPIEYLKTLHEIRKSSELLGKKFDHPEVLRIREVIKSNSNDATYKHSDEETFAEARLRAQKVLEYLATLKYKNIVCVSHGDFLPLILLCMMLGDEFTHHEYSRFRKFTTMHNTGITMCGYNEERGWHLLTLNDYAHLGEI